MIVHTNDFSMASATFSDHHQAFTANLAGSKHNLNNNNSPKTIDTNFYLTKEVTRDLVFDPDYDEEADEEFSDDECMEDEQQQTALQDDVTTQLLKFAEAVNNDIQKLFGRKKGEDDSCDIYEDKWTSGKSGRELYYAELLKIAQGGDIPSNSKCESDLDGTANSSKPINSGNDFSGKVDKKIGIGPLTELFEYGLRDYMNDKSVKFKKKVKRLKFDIKKYEQVVPMSDRKLPKSFWNEPGSNNSNIAKNGIISSNSNIIDFSDLIDSWDTDEDASDNDSAMSV